MEFFTINISIYINIIKNTTSDPKNNKFNFLYIQLCTICKLY